MGSAIDVVTAFYESIGRKDHQSVRKMLHKDFSFRGPIMSFDDPDSFVESMTAMAMDGGPHSPRFITDGKNVAHICKWRMTLPKPVDIPVCEIFTLADGKIASIELFFDTKQLNCED